MVKSDKMKTNTPTVTIMPYFFTKMIKADGPMVPVWPNDGAAISPIFMLTKKDKAEKIKTCRLFSRRRGRNSIFSSRIISYCKSKCR